MARKNDKCITLCDFCQTGGECLEGHDTRPEHEFNPDYYAGVDMMKSGDELITQERDRQVFELNYPIARDLATWRGEELENSIMFLLTGTHYHPTIWGDNDIKIAQVRAKPIQVRRVMAGALLCAMIDVDNLKRQILINEKKQAPGALMGEKPCTKQCDKSNFPEGTCDCYNMGLIK